jgi:hypothetical protein
MLGAGGWLASRMAAKRPPTLALWTARAAVFFPNGGNNSEKVVSMDRGRVGGVIDGGTVATVRWDELEHWPHRALQLTPPDGHKLNRRANRCATAAVRRRELLGGLIP